uniref:Uncharacterized protein n=1 Tax=Podarcis muralis TaxID=64176 RepID=A0A670JWG2_PODMU
IFYKDHYFLSLLEFLLTGSLISLTSSVNAWCQEGGKWCPEGMGHTFNMASK